MVEKLLKQFGACSLTQDEKDILETFLESGSYVILEKWLGNLLFAYNLELNKFHLTKDNEQEFLLKKHRVQGAAEFLYKMDDALKKRIF